MFQIGLFSLEHFFQTIQHCRLAVADMVLLQLNTRCRTGDIVRLTRGDIKNQGNDCVARVRVHKYGSLVSEREIVFNEYCNVILLKYTFLKPHEFLFQPCKSENDHRAKELLITALNTDIATIEDKRTREVRQGVGKPNVRYTIQSYTRAIQSACSRAFPTPEGCSALEAAYWRARHHWTPDDLINFENVLDD